LHWRIWRIVSAWLLRCCFCAQPYSFLINVWKYIAYFNS
jgi:hypothetical protein